MKTEVNHSIRYSDLLGEWDRKQEVLLAWVNGLNQKGFIKLIGDTIWQPRKEDLEGYSKKTFQIIVQYGSYKIKK